MSSFGPSFRAAALGVAVLGVACGKKAPPSPATVGSAPSAFRPAAAVASGLPGVSDQVSKVVNPENKPAYSGPTGGVRGLVSATGDEPTVATAHVQSIKGACPEARESYGRVFRQGMMRSLADVLVAVTGYTGYVPEKTPKQVVAARGCAFSTRTLALTFGQTVEVQSKDRDTYVPNLLGSGMRVQLFALPGGAGSTVYPPEPGHYVLTDDVKVFMYADVFVLKYATHDVTGLDGRYEITGIPVGPVKISALLPATGVSVEKSIEIKASEVLDVPLELGFDAKTFELKASAIAASAAASAPKAPRPKTSAP